MTPVQKACGYGLALAGVPAAFLYFSALQRVMGIAGAALLAGGTVLGVARGLYQAGLVNHDEEGWGKTVHTWMISAERRIVDTGATVKGFLTTAQEDITKGFPGIQNYSTALKMAALGAVLYKLGNWSPL